MVLTKLTSTSLYVLLVRYVQNPVTNNKNSQHKINVKNGDTRVQKDSSDMLVQVDLNLKPFLKRYPYFDTLHIFMQCHVSIRISVKVCSIV